MPINVVKAVYGLCLMVVFTACGLEPESNSIPIAKAGANRDALIQHKVMLDGSKSYDLNNQVLHYHWRISTKPNASNADLTNEDTATPSFTPDSLGDYNLELIVNDGESNSFPSDIKITAIENDTTDPIFTSSNAVSVNENQLSAITLVANDNTGQVQYSIAGGDASSFTVNSGTGVVVFKTAPDFETQSSYSFTATATDPSGNTATQEVTITIIDLLEGGSDTTDPIFTSNNAVSVNENQLNAITLVANDNSGQVQYSIAGGDASSFTVNSGTGVVVFKTAPDFETQSSYSFTATATDPSGNTATQEVTITIIDLPEGGIDRSVIRTVNLTSLAQAQGQTISAYLQDQFDQTQPVNGFTSDDTIIFEGNYAPGNPTVVYKSGNWASSFDFSGVPWNGVRGGALVTDQYVIYAAHYPRSIGSTVYFNAPDGTIVSRTIVASKNLNSYDGTILDAAVHKLNAPVPSNIKVYKLLDSQGLGALSGLIGAPYLITDKTRHVFAEEIYSFNSFDNGTYNGTHIVNYWKNNSLPSSMFHAAVSGDSGNPQFMIVNGELVLTGTLFFYSNGKMINDFYGFEALQNSLQQAIDDMSGL